MPFRRTTAKRKRREDPDELTLGMLHWLLRGNDSFGWLGGKVESVDAAKAAWDKHKSRVMAVWFAGWRMPEHWLHIFYHPMPGYRPYAWWRWDAPEPLRLIGFQRSEGRYGTSTPPRRWIEKATPEQFEALCERSQKLHPDKPTSWGMPSAYDPDAIFEPEREYLERLGLIDDEERAGIARMEGVLESERIVLDLWNHRTTEAGPAADERPALVARVDELACIERMNPECKAKWRDFQKYRGSREPNVSVKS